MSSISWDTFERYRQKGLDARRAGQWDSARIYLLEAARSMVALSKETSGEDLKQGRREMANRLLELARDCEKAKQENRPRGSSGGRGSERSSAPAESDGGSSA